MPKRRPKRLYVRLNEHAELRWLERAERPIGKLERMLAAILIEQLGVGLQVHEGRAVLYLSKDRLDLPRDLYAFIDPPNIHGVWRVVTFRTIKRKGA